MEKATIDGLFSVLANGHSFKKHVLGNRTDRSELAGLNEFRHPDYGRDLKINTPNDLHGYLKK